MSTHKPKSILKKTKQPSPPQNPPQNVDDEQNTERVAWDEANLQLNEDERIAAGPRMKIDEPKTPYHESIAPDVELLDDFSLGPAVVQNNNIEPKNEQNGQDQNLHQTEYSDLSKQNMLLNRKNIQEKELSEESSSEEEDDPYEGLSSQEKDEKIEKHKRFEEMRKSHYNMKQSMFKKAVNPLKAAAMMDNDEDDDDSDYHE
jgi:protein phosphatase inhibitor 2